MVNMLKEEKLFNMAYIKSNFNFEEPQLELLFDYAKFLYDCGLYSGTSLMRTFRGCKFTKLLQKTIESQRKDHQCIVGTTRMLHNARPSRQGLRNLR